MEYIKKQQSIRHFLESLKQQNMNFKDAFSFLKPNQQLFIKKQALINNFVAEEQTNQRHFLINIDKEFDDFLLNKSKQTQNSYKVALAELKKFVKTNDILKLKRSDAERFLYFLIKSKQLANNSVRLRILAIKSFYEYLATNYKYINNPFKYLKLPRQVKKTREQAIF